MLRSGTVKSSFFARTDPAAKKYLAFPDHINIIRHIALDNEKSPSTTITKAKAATTEGSEGNPINDRINIRCQNCPDNRERNQYSCKRPYFFMGHLLAVHSNSLQFLPYIISKNRFFRKPGGRAAQLFSFLMVSRGGVASTCTPSGR